MPKSKRKFKKLEGWLCYAYDHSKEIAHPKIKGWFFVSYELGKLSKRGRQKIVRLYEKE